MQTALTVLVLQMRRWWSAQLPPSSTTAGRGAQLLGTLGTLRNREVILGIMTHDTSRRREPESWKRGYYDSDGIGQADPGQLTLAATRRESGGDGEGGGPWLRRGAAATGGEPDLGGEGERRRWGGGGPWRRRSLSARWHECAGTSARARAAHDMERGVS